MASAIPDALLQAVTQQRVVLFIGAGASLEAVDKSNNRPPTATALRDQIARHFFNDAMSSFDLSVLAEMAIQSHGEAAVYDHVRAILEPFEPSKAHRLLCSFRWRGIATTNYDVLIDTAYADPLRLQTLIPFVKDAEPVEDRLQKANQPLMYLKLHGCLNHLHDNQIPLILSAETYAQYSKHRTRLYSRLKDWAFESAFVFIGYQLGDPHIRKIIYELAEDHIKRPAYYLIAPEVPPAAAQFWSTRNVHALQMTFGTFMNELDRAIPKNSRALQTPSETLKQPIRNHFSTNEPTPQLLLDALEKDFTHVHPQMAIAEQEQRKFYQGFDTGWGAIFQRLDFPRRTVEELIFDAILDAPTGSEFEFYVVTGAAGAGKSVTLKRTAWEAAADHNAIVLWLNEDGALNYSAVAELHRLTGKRVFLFIDRIAPRATDVEAFTTTAKLRGLPVTIVGAERQNEWNVYCDNLQATAAPVELPVPNLTRPEIELLLDLLRKHNALGHLAGLERDEQIRAFAERAEHVLLVALHEATLGKPFEQIVLEEYSNVTPERARQLYLDVCTLHQYNVPARAGTISRVAGISFNDFAENFLRPLEDVVLVGVDRYTGDKHYRARHSHIASLVFRQVCSDDTKRLDQLTRILSALDIGYSADKRVYDEIIKGRGLVTEFNTTQPGRQLFSEALRISPGNAYIFQQWAIFELHHDQGSLEQADKLSRSALEMEPNSRAILHTNAVVARERARAATTVVMKDQYRKLARERLSEMNADRDKYVLSTRLNLLIDEVADLVSSLGEPVNEADQIALRDKVRDTEAALTRYGQYFPDESEPFEAEARLRQILEQHAQAVRALERAWTAGPRGSAVAIRLARHYTAQDQPDRSEQILRAAITRDPDDRGAHLTMAQHLIEKAPGDQAAILSHLARGYAPGDQNFEARYIHAQYLFACGRPKEALEVFVSLDKLAPAAFRRRAPQTDTQVSRNLPRHSGTITTLKPSMAFIRSASYPSEIFAHANDTARPHWTALRIGDAVTFKIRFNRKGPVAHDIHLTHAKR